MKEVLIIFIILLVLLLMVSVLGGSIRLKSDEHYDDDIPLYDEYLLPPKMKPWESHPTFIPRRESNNFPSMPTTPSAPSMPSSGKELNYKYKPSGHESQPKVSGGIINERNQVMEVSGAQGGDLDLDHEDESTMCSGVEDSVGVEEDVAKIDGMESLFEPVVEESCDQDIVKSYDTYDEKYTNQISQVSQEINDEHVSELYMSDPHQYEEKSMKNVLPFNRVSDFAEF